MEERSPRLSDAPVLEALAPVAPRRESAAVLLGLGASVVGAWLLQTTVTAFLPLTWPRPDVVLVTALLWGFLRGANEGLLAAIVGGVLLDLSSSGPFGLHLLALGLAVFLVANPSGPFGRSPLRRAAGTGLAAGGVHLVLLVVLQLRGWDIWWAAALGRSLAPALVLDVLAVVVLAPVLQGRGRVAGRLGGLP